MEKQKKPCLFKTDGSSNNVMPKKGVRFTLEELQGFVDGFIEVVGLTEELVMIVNEDGHILHLPINPAATRIAAGYCKIGMFPKQYVYGNVIVCPKYMIE